MEFVWLALLFGFCFLVFPIWILLDKHYARRLKKIQEEDNRKYNNY